jgi:hypothetical protein
VSTIGKRAGDSYRARSPRVGTSVPEAGRPLELPEPPREPCESSAAIAPRRLPLQPTTWRRFLASPRLTPRARVDRHRRSRDAAVRRGSSQAPETAEARGPRRLRITRVASPLDRQSCVWGAGHPCLGELAASDRDRALPPLFGEACPGCGELHTYVVTERTASPLQGVGSNVASGAVGVPSRTFRDYF